MPKLDELVVEFVSKGFEDLKATISALVNQIAGVGSTAAAAASLANSSFGKLKGAVEITSSAAASLGKGVSAGVNQVNQATAGMSASVNQAASSLSGLGASATTLAGTAATAMGGIGTSTAAGMAKANAATAGMAEPIERTARAVAGLNNAAKAYGDTAGEKMAQATAGMTQTGKAAWSLSGALASISKAFASIGSASRQAAAEAQAEMKGLRAAVEAVYKDLHGIKDEPITTEASDIAKKFGDVSSSAGAAGGKAAGAFGAINTATSLAGKSVANLTNQVKGVKVGDLGDLSRLKLPEPDRSLEKGLQGLALGIAATQTALQGMVNGIKSFISQGISASQIGDVLNYSMERLSLTIGGMFRPEIEAILGAIQKLTRWIDSWSASTKSIVATIITVSIVTLGLAAAMGVAVVAVQALTAAIVELEGATGIGALLPVIGGIVAALGGLVIGTEAGRAGLASLFSALAPLGNAFLGLWNALKPVFDALWDTFSSIGGIFITLVDVVGTAIQALVPILTLIGSVLGAVFQLVTVPFKILEGVIEGFWNVLKEVFGAIGDVINPIINAFTNLFDLLGDGVKWLGDLLKGFAKTLIELVLFPLRLLAWALKAVGDAINATLQALGLKTTLPDHSAKKGAKEDRGALQRKSSGFGSLESFYERIAKESVGMGAGKSVEEQQLAVQQGIAAAVAGIANASPATPQVVK